MQSVAAQSIAAAAFLLVSTLPAPAAAQCAGDCSSDNAVTVDELLLGVNIALGVDSVTECEPFDVNMSGDVTVDELLGAVNNALNGCPPPTTPTPKTPGVCGDGHVNFDQGETCDDGNTVEGDTCPADCKIRPCTAAGTMLNVDVSFTPPAGVDIAGITVFLRYPDGVVRIPGFADDASVLNRITNLPDNGFPTSNDLDYALRLVLFSADASPFTPGRLFTVQFDNCQGAAAPSANDFRCTVESAADVNSSTVAGVTCGVTLP
jgi:cysteine-rich repeat protein